LEPPILSGGAVRALLACSWPGNVRELENTIERAVTLNRGGFVTEEDLPAAVRSAERADAPAHTPDTLFADLPTIDELERRYLGHVLQIAGGNRKRASEILGINRRTLYRMAVRFGLEL
jgi:DNA-binding NtrC family response regulator